MSPIHNQFKRACTALMLGALLSSGSMFAGTLRGVVRDVNGNKPVEGAIVLIRSGDFETVAASDDKGEFSLADLKPGTYEVNVSYAGAKPEKKDVTIGESDTLALQFGISTTSAQAEVYNISVTGSLIGATARDTAIPLYGVDRETNEKKGDPTVLEQIKSMPIGGPVFGDNNPFNADAQFRAGSGTINIRGLGPKRTLVLLNGRRFSPNNLQPPDTNLLPASVIGRVEILKDGAAATYGSDALAGVANFFTRQDIDGVEFNADYRLVPNSTGDVNASGAFGHTWEGGNFLLSLGYQYRGALKALDRSWSIQPYATNPSPYSPYNNPGTWAIIAQDPAAPAPPPFTPIRVGVGFEAASCLGMGGTIGWAQTGATTFLPLCYTRLPHYELVTEQHQVQLYSELNTKVGSSSKLHLEALYASTNLPNIRIGSSFPVLNGPTGPGTPFIVPANNPFFANFFNQNNVQPWPPDLPPIGAASAVWQPFGMGGAPDGGALGERYAYNKNEEIRLSAELFGETGLMDTNYRLGGTYIIESQLGSFPDILVDRMQRALNGLGGPNCTGNTPGPTNNSGNCKWLNPFASGVPGDSVTGQANPNFVQGNQVDPVLAQWLHDTKRENRWRTDLAVIDGVVDGTVPFELPGGEPTWALGAQYRHTTSYATADNPLFNALVTPCPTPGSTNCAVKNGPYVFSSGLTPNFAEQSVYAIFGQLDIPTFDAWKISFGLRFEDYGTTIGNTFNPQFRTKWQIFDFFALRGSIGTAFRGPSSTDVAEGVQITQLNPITAVGGNFRANDIVGNPNLKPEKALTFNVGGIIQVENFTSTIDYWFYKIDDQIARAPADLIATASLIPNTPAINCASPFILNRTVILDNNNACTLGTTTGQNIARVTSNMVNGPSLTTTGLDIDANYVFDNIFGGALSLGGVASVMLSYQQEDFILQTINIQPKFDAVGFTNYNRIPGTIPRWRGEFFINYNLGWHNVRLSTTYTDGAEDNRGPTTVRVGATPVGGVPTVTNFGVNQSGYTGLDLVYQLSLPWDMRLTLSGLNLIGMDPPGARLPFAYDPAIGNPLGRTFKFGINQKF